jgi:hypothetical protein
MFTGGRVIVFVDEGGGHLSPREIALGAKSDDHYQVISGLTERDRVVVSGNFLIDSEPKLKAVISQMTEDAPAGHAH